MDFRYVAIGAVFASALLGCCSALLMGLQSHSDTSNASSHKFQFLKLFSAGVMAALAVVHIAPDASEALETLCEGMACEGYPLGEVSVLAGLLLLAIADHATHCLRDNVIASVIKNVNVDLEENVQAADVENVKDQSNDKPFNDNNDSTSRTSDSSVIIFELACMFHSLIIGLSLGLTVPPVQFYGPEVGPKSEDSQSKNEQYQNFSTITIALAVHQLLEGVSLGCILCESSASRVRKFIVMAVYSSMAPLGIGLGILLTCQVQTSMTAHWIAASSGVLQGLSAGLLLYVALVQIVMEEFGKVKTIKTIKTIKTTNPSNTTNTTNPTNPSNTTNTTKTTKTTKNVNTTKTTNNVMTPNGVELSKTHLTTRILAMYASLLLGASTMCALAVWM